MTTTITAIYEQGVFRPLEPLSVPEHTRVILQMQEVPPLDERISYRQQIQQMLILAGLSWPPHETPPSISPLSVTRRAELAHRFSVGQPLSEIIVAEREER